MKTTMNYSGGLISKFLVGLLVLSLFFIASTQYLTAQDKSTTAVMLFDAKGVDYDNESFSNLVRMELEKVKYFSVMDKYEMFERLTGNEFEYSSCFGQTCLLEAGEILDVDNVLSGTVEVISDKIVISLRLINVEAGNISRSNIMEFIDRKELLDRMVQVSIRDLLGLEIDQTILKQLNKDEEPIAPPTNYYKLNGPRIGVAYITGDRGDVLQRPKNKGGYDGYPVLSQIGYQLEVQYLGAGNFVALVEMLFMVSGMEQQLFLPSVVFTNGFRLNKQGWEVAFGPTVNLSKKATGFYDTDGLMGGSSGEWYLTGEWIEENPGIENPYEDDFVERMDSRGAAVLTTGWIWAIGKTFHSGYLNIPVNAYISPKKEGWYVGMSVGFNMASKASR